MWLRREALCRLIRGWRGSCFPLLTPWLYKQPFPKKSGFKLCFLPGLRSQPSLVEISDYTPHNPPRSPEKKYCVWHILTISSKVNARIRWVQRPLWCILEINSDSRVVCVPVCECVCPSVCVCVCVLGRAGWRQVGERQRTRESPTASLIEPEIKSEETCKSLRCSEPQQPPLHNEGFWRDDV